MEESSWSIALAELRSSTRLPEDLDSRSERTRSLTCTDARALASDVEPESTPIEENFQRKSSKSTLIHEKEA